jgi:hypothetical protein
LICSGLHDPARGDAPLCACHLPEYLDWQSG